MGNTGSIVVKSNTQMKFPANHVSPRQLLWMNRNKKGFSIRALVVWYAMRNLVREIAEVSPLFLLRHNTDIMTASKRVLFFVGEVQTTSF